MVVAGSFHCMSATTKIGKLCITARKNLKPEHFKSTNYMHIIDERKLASTHLEEFMQDHKTQQITFE